VPVFDDGAAPVRRTFYVPEGEWFDLHDDTRYAGPGFHTVDVPLERMPVLVRSGAVIPRVAVDETVRSVEDLHGRPWTLHAYGDVGSGHDLVGFDTLPAAVVGEVVRHGV
jgi:alpha-D-xyloside xylohydrolase